MILRYLAIILLAIVCHLTGFAAWTDSGRRLLHECENDISLRRYPELLDNAARLERIGRAGGNFEEEVAGRSYRLRALVVTRDKTDITKDFEYLKSLIDNRDEGIDDPVLTTAAASAVSLYYQYILSDYSQSLLYAFKALDASRKGKLEQEEIGALSSVASIYFQKRDSTGYSYAQEAYAKAKNSNLDQSIYVTACNMANYLYNMRQSARALQYLNEAAAKARQYDMTWEEPYINSFFGDIYNVMDDPKKAEEYYKKSLADAPGSSLYDRIYARLCYAQFFISRQRNQEAISLLLETESTIEKEGVDIFRNELYRLLSQAYEYIGDPAKALGYHKKYMEATLTLFSEAKEKEFAILDLRYRIAEEKNKNAEHSLELMRRGRLLLMLLSVAAVLVLVVAGLIVFYVRRSKYYKAIIARYLDNARSERELRGRLETALSELKEAQPKSRGTLNEDKAMQLFRELERLMREEHIYRDCHLSLNSAASSLATNRTYLSQVVNTKAGKSFAAYVNDFRLDESVELLMDPSNRDSLKTIGKFVGFLSPSNFYSLFRRKVGVSPSVFRSNCKGAANK